MSSFTLHTKRCIYVIQDAFMPPDTFYTINRANVRSKTIVKWWNNHVKLDRRWVMTTAHPRACQALGVWLKATQQERTIVSLTTHNDAIHRGNFTHPTFFRGKRRWAVENLWSRPTIAIQTRMQKRIAKKKNCRTQDVNEAIVPWCLRAGIPVIWF